MSTSSNEVIRIVVEVLGLERSGRAIDSATKLLGSLPEFDSMAVVAILTAIEDEFGLSIADDEVDAELFESVATLAAFVDTKRAG